MGFDLPAVVRAIAEGRLTWQQHALQRLTERGIPQEDVLQCIADAQILEEYPDDYPLPSALVLCRREGRPLHVVVAWDAELARAYVITVYIPDSMHFAEDYRTRRT